MKAKEMFETYGQASDFCKENGFTYFPDHDPWRLADKIISIKEKQRKATIDECSKKIGEYISKDPMMNQVYKNGLVRASQIINSKED